MTKFKLTSFSKDLPKRFKLINWLILLPILLWPLVFFMTIFFFDNPNSNPIKVWILFIGVNAYPLFLFLLFEVNTRIYKKINIIGYVIPFSIIGFLAFVFMKEYNSTKKFYTELNFKNQERKEKGFIGNCDTYKIKNDTIFYNDIKLNGDPNKFNYLSCHYGKDENKVFKEHEQIIDCDASSFEIVDWQWQKDKNKYFHHGVAMNDIDYESFEILIANYSRDKNNVYYYNKVMEYAEPSTFKVNIMSHIGTDKNHSYKYGEIVVNH